MPNDAERTRDAPTTDAAEWSALMARAQEGDTVAYRRLLDGITPYLRAIASRAHRNPGEVEDTMQDILLTLHSIRHTYDASRPFKPWLAGIAQHRVVDRLRRQGRVSAREVTLEAEHETFPAPESNLETGAIDGRLLQQALDALPEGQRRAITLLKLREMTLKEAAVASGMSVASLKVATHRGIKALRRRFGPGDGAA